MRRRVRTAEKNALSPGEISASSSSRRVKGRKWRYEDTAERKRQTAGVSRSAKSSSRDLLMRRGGAVRAGRRRKGRGRKKGVRTELQGEVRGG